MSLGGWCELVSSYGKPGRGKPYFAKSALSSARNSVLRLNEEAVYGARVRRTKVRRPVFILGFWRSGTTHLQNLFALDNRLTTPNKYQVGHPHTFLTTEARAERRLAGQALRKRVQDNVLAGWFTADEDETALATMTRLSILLGTLYPDPRHDFTRFLSLRDVSDAQREDWKRALKRFAKKLTVKSHRPLVFKSPAHTARVRLLLEIFPDARFVHIHRNPYRIFRSYENMAKKMMGSVVEENREAFRTSLIEMFEETYRCYFEDRAAIPDGRLSEIGFDDLEQDPVATMRSVYDELDLPEFSAVKPDLERYVASLQSYKKNSFPDLKPETAERVDAAWAPYFEEWGYAQQTAVADKPASRSEPRARVPETSPA